MIKFMLITNSPKLAKHAESCGVARVFVDLERNGKQERQGHLDTLISQHSMQDVRKVREVLSSAELLVRLNPLYEGSAKEIDEAIAAGADFLMLPMFRTVEEISHFASLVAGRAGVIPLVETHDAAMAMREIVQVKGVTEIYIGLNDLHLDMNLSFMFELLAGGLVDSLVEIIKEAGLPFGFGGIARIGEGIIPGEMVLGEHLRLGSSSVILSRTFHRKNEGVIESVANQELGTELQNLIDSWTSLRRRSSSQILINQKKLQKAVKEYVARIKN